MRYSPVLEMSNQHAEPEREQKQHQRRLFFFFFYCTQSKTHRNKKRKEKRCDLVSTTQNCDRVRRKKCKKNMPCLWDAQQGWQEVVQLDLRGRGPEGFFARGCARAISPPYHLAPANPCLHVVATERTTQQGMRRSSNPQSSLTVLPDWLLAQVALGAGFDRCWRGEILQLVRGVPGCHSCPSSVSRQPDPFSSSRHHLTTASTSIRPTITTTTPNPWRLSRLRVSTGRNLDVIREAFIALLCFLSPFCSFSCT